MRPLLWVTAVTLLVTTAAIENNTDKSKRQTENIRSPQNLQYSLVLPHSRVSSFRALGNRRIASAPLRPAKLPPYAVQMEPMVQYSQKDPLYDPNHDRLEDGAVNKNELQAQPKILNTNEYTELQGEDSHIEHSFGPPYGALPTAPLYGHNPHYYEQPEPIIEIIIKESNETLPAPPQPPPQHVRKEPVQVFYVKYSKDPHSEHKVIYDKPIPAITPPTNIEEHHRESYVTVTPEPAAPLPPSTTLRTIIKPESEVYHSESGVKVTFGTESNHQHHRDEYSGSEGHEETAPRPAIAYPQQTTHPESHPQQKFQYNEQYSRPAPSFSNAQNFRPPQQQHAQSRIQFQQPYLPNEQQLPRQTTPQQSFRTFQSHLSRQGPFGPPTPPSYVNGPNHKLPGPIGPSFPNAQTNQPGPISQGFPNIHHHPPGPTGQTFVNGPPRPHNLPSFQPRPTNTPPAFHQRPNPQSTNLPPRNSFHSGPQRPFHAGPQLQHLFNEPKYLQENYHTITTEQVDPPKQQQNLVHNRPQQNFEFVPRPSPVPQPSPTPISQEEYNKRYYPHFHEQSGRPGDLPVPQQVPQQRPPQQYLENAYNRPGPSSRPPTPSAPQFQNFRPNQEQSNPPFHQQVEQQQQQFSHHQHQQFHHQHQQSQPQQSSSQPQTQFPRPESSHINNRFPGPTAPQPSARPQFTQNNPSEHSQHNFNGFHQQNVGQLVPNGGELVAAIPKYEQHITVSGPGSQTQNNYNGLSEPTPTPALSDQQLRQQVQQQFHSSEQEQVRKQLAQNVQKQQEEIQRLQNQLIQARHQQNVQQDQQKQYQQNYHFPSDNKQDSQNFQKSYNQQKSQKQYIPQERSKSPSALYSSSTNVPFYQSTSRTVEITPTTQRYGSSTPNSINSTPEAKKTEKKKRPTIELPDEVPDDLRQQLLSSGILDNADISVLDYDKVGDTPLDSLPPDQLANFFSAGGAQQIAASENRPVVVKPSGEQIYSRIDDTEDDDQEPSASENIATVVVAPPVSASKNPVEMKVVHFDPATMEGQSIAQEYVKKDATRLEPVALNDKKYNRYLPLKVSGNQFPVPDVLKGKKVTSVVVLAPVQTEALSDHTRLERATENKLKGIKFIAGDSLQKLLKDPSKQNFKTWLNTEKMTSTEQQSVILLVTGNEDPAAEKEIFMYDPESDNVNKLSGDLSSAFVEAAENNSLSRDIEKLAIEGEGRPESFRSSPTTDAPEETNGDVAEESGSTEDDDEMMSESSDDVPLYADFSSMKLNPDGSQVLISSGYSKMKKGRAISHK